MIEGRIITCTFLRYSSMSIFTKCILDCLKKNQNILNEASSYLMNYFSWLKNFVLRCFIFNHTHHAAQSQNECWLMSLAVSGEILQLGSSFFLCIKHSHFLYFKEYILELKKLSLNCRCSFSPFVLFFIDWCQWQTPDCISVRMNKILFLFFVQQQYRDFSIPIF